MKIELTNQFANAVLLNRFSKFVRAELLRDERRRAERPERVEGSRRDEQDRDQREDDRQDGDDVPPADGAEPALASHRLISSRAAVRRKPMIETVATMMKMSTDTAAA